MDHKRANYRFELIRALVYTEVIAITNRLNAVNYQFNLIKYIIYSTFIKETVYINNFIYCEK